MIPEFNFVTHFYCYTCEKLLYRGNLRRHRFTKNHQKIISKQNKV